jgi:hypothetical protein
MEGAMSLKETQFTATGPASIGFQTEPPETSTKFQIGVDASGLDIGVKGTGTLGEQSPPKPNSGATGVQGNGSGVGWGVAGFGGDAPAGTGPVAASACAGVFGVGGAADRVGPPGDHRLRDARRRPHRRSGIPAKAPRRTTSIETG